MHKDVISWIGQCLVCATKRPQNKSVLGSWKTCDRWDRLHIDWALPPNSRPILIVVDASTNFLDAVPCSDRTTQCVKRCLARLFGLFGLPRTVVSDNAPEFVNLAEWLSSMGVKLVHSPPYHPASNGPAERAVRTVKEALKCYDSKMGDQYIYLQKVLLNHRACSGKTSPAEALIGYKPRTTVNAKFSLGSEMVFKNQHLKTNTPVKYIVQSGNNTAWVSDTKKTWLASLSQLVPVHSDEEDLQTCRNWKSTRPKRQPDRFAF